MLQCLIIFGMLLMAGCERQEKIDLNSIKKNFLLSTLEGELEESPFQMDYELKTVFFSRDIVSLFGQIFVYDHLPHGWWRYEGKTLCRVHGKLKEISLWDLFPTMKQKEFLRLCCENLLKNDSISYFSGTDPLRTCLEYEDMHTFVIDDKFFIVIFQPYTVGGLGDGPTHVKIPYSRLREHWNRKHPLPQLLDRILSSKAYTASWERDWNPQEEIAISP